MGTIEYRRVLFEYDWSSEATTTCRPFPAPCRERKETACASTTCRPRCMGRVGKDLSEFVCPCQTPFRNTGRRWVALSSRSARHRRRRTDLRLSVLAYCCLSPVQTPPKSGCLIRDVFSGRRVAEPLGHSPLVARRPQFECLLNRFCFLDFS